MKKFLIIAIAITLVGCATNYGAQQIDDFGRYTQLQVDQTTKEGTYELFGQPHDVKYLENDESVWVYFSVSMTMSGATFIPFIGILAGGNNANTRIANFYFSQDDLYQKVETLTNTQYVNQWVGIATIGVQNDEMTRVDEEMTKLELPFDQNLARQMKGTAELLGQ